MQFSQLLPSLTLVLFLLHQTTAGTNTIADNGAQPFQEGPDNRLIVRVSDCRIGLSETKFEVAGLPVEYESRFNIDCGEHNSATFNDTRFDTYTLAGFKAMVDILDEMNNMTVRVAAGGAKPFELDLQLKNCRSRSTKQEFVVWSVPPSEELVMWSVPHVETMDRFNIDCDMTESLEKTWIPFFRDGSFVPSCWKRSEGYNITVAIH